MRHLFFILIFCLTVFRTVAVSSEKTDTITYDRVTITINDEPVQASSDSIRIPEPLRQNDLVAVVSPSGQAEDTDFEMLAEILKAKGLRCRIGNNAAKRLGSFAGSVDERYSDLREALLDPEIKAVICTRGGYGAVHLLDSLDRLPLHDNAKWLVGFSDISALHALLLSHGVASVHGPIGRHFKLKDNDLVPVKSTDSGCDSTADYETVFPCEAPYSYELTPSGEALFALLAGRHVTYSITPHPYNHAGNATAMLTGGNMAVLDALISTPFDEFRPGTILIIEDDSEPIYKIQRQLYQLKLNGVLGQLAGLIVGDFTKAGTDEDFSDMNKMIHEMVAGYDYPVAFGVPVGHGDVNIPFLIGCPIEMNVSPDGVTLHQ